MRFQAEHHFHGSPDAVVAVLADPNFYIGLQLPDLSRPEVLEDRTEGQTSVIRLRYEFVGSLDPLARRLLGNRRLAWVQEISIDQGGDSGQLKFGADADPKRLHGSAEFVLVDDAGGCIRRLSGELVVAVPVVGPRAEKKIVPGLLRRLDIEAQAVDRILET